MIKIRGLCKSYGNSVVLNHLDLDIVSGETLVILGRSGVGKSVLLKHILGITRPDKGYVEVDGERVSDLQGADLFHAIKKMGMLFQGGALFDSMSVAENTAFHLKEHGNPETGLPYTDREVEEIVNEALAMVDLAGTGSKSPAELSGGMKKRAALARVIAYKPKIILYDEPTTGLDPVTGSIINQLIRKTQKKLKATSIVVTHDIASAYTIADKLALHRDGKILYMSEPDSFLKIDDELIQAFAKLLPANRASLRSAI